MNLNIKSIKLKYIISALSICVISLIVVSIMSYLVSYNITAQQSNTRIHETALRKATELDAWFNQYGGIIANMAEDIEISDKFDKELTLQNLEGKLGLHKSTVMDFYIGLENSKCLLSGAGWVPEADYDYKSRSWYINCLKSDKVLYTEPYVDAMTGRMVVTISKSIKNKSDGKIIGVIAADIFIDNIIKVVKEFNIGDSSYTFLLDEKGDILSHINKAYLPAKNGLKNISSLNVKDYSKIQTTLKSKELNTLEIKDYDGYDKYFILSKINSTGWIFGISVSKSEYKKPLDKLLEGFVFAFLVSIFIGILIILKFITNMVAPIKSLNNTVKSFTADNMNVRSDLNFVDEIGELSKSFNRMADTIQEYSINLENKVDERTRELSEKNERIMESIDYAQRLQCSMLPVIDEKFGISAEHHFIIWKPRDTVGGDMYWFKKKEGYALIGVADCTGHGVPGALMTMTLGAILESFSGSFDALNPSQMLYEINDRLKQTLGQNKIGSIADDGADIALCIYNTHNSTLTFAGAKLSIFIVQNNEITEYKGSRYSVGYSNKRSVDFADIQIKVEQDMTFYITTDGLLDQNSSQSNNGMAKSGFKKLIKTLNGKSMPQQKQIIEDEINQRLANTDQRDDITIVGLRFN